MYNKAHKFSPWKRCAIWFKTIARVLAHEKEKRVEEEQLILRKESMQIPGKGAREEFPGCDNVRAYFHSRKNEWPEPNPALAQCKRSPHLEIISSELSNLLCAGTRKRRRALVYLKVIHTHKPLNGDGK